MRLLGFDSCGFSFFCLSQIVTWVNPIVEHCPAVGILQVILSHKILVTCQYWRPWRAQCYGGRLLSNLGNRVGKWCKSSCPMFHLNRSQINGTCACYKPRFLNTIRCLHCSWYPSARFSTIHGRIVQLPHYWQGPYFVGYRWWLKQIWYFLHITICFFRPCSVPYA